MKIYLGADHAGFELKNTLRKHLEEAGHEVEDLGAKTLDPQDDYPHYAYAVTAKLLGDEGEDAKGILICGSGQGMAMAANRVGGIRAAVIWSVDGARETRKHNDSNVLTLPAHMIDEATALQVADAWLGEKFLGEDRHQRRLDELEQLYG